MIRRILFLILNLMLFLGLASVASAGKLEEDKLRDAAEKGDIVTVRALLDQGVDINAKSVSGNTALLCAAQNNHSDMMRFLIDKGADVNAKGKDDGTGAATAILFAATNGQADIVKLLLDRGADVNAATNKIYGNMTLVGALSAGHSDVAKILIERGADTSNKYIIMIAAASSTPDVLRALISKGANVNARNTFIDGHTPLMYAAETGNSDNVRFLIDNGADINARDWLAGYTALMMAADKKRMDVIRVLISKGADLNAKTAYGDTALSIANSYPEGYDDVIKVLKGAGAKEKSEFK
jgi:ankyrin repeat protein